MRVLDFGRPVGPGHPPYIIAALDCRELRSFERAAAALDAAGASQADAVRFTRMPWAWAARLYQHAATRGVTMLASALDEAAVERHDWLGAAGFALVYDWSDLDLIACAARTGKPIVLQVGTASEAELAEVVETARTNGAGGVALVRAAIDVELDGLDGLACHGVVVGVADRLPGAEIAAAAIARGASIIEKRFLPAADGATLCRREVSAVVRDCELAWAALGHPLGWGFN